MPLQALQELALGPENVPKEHSVAIPLAHLDPAGQLLQLLAPASENDVPLQALQELKSGPENVPTEH